MLINYDVAAIGYFIGVLVRKRIDMGIFKKWVATAELPPLRYTYVCNNRSCKELTYSHGSVKRRRVCPKCVPKYWREEDRRWWAGVKRRFVKAKPPTVEEIPQPDFTNYETGGWR